MRAIFALAMLFYCPSVLAQEHHHPPQDAAMHDRFYKTWDRTETPRMPERTSAPASGVTSIASYPPQEAEFMDSVKNGAAWAWSFAKLVYDLAISAIEHFPQTTFWTGLALVTLAVWL